MAGISVLDHAPVVHLFGQCSLEQGEVLISLMPESFQKSRRFEQSSEEFLMRNPACRGAFDMVSRPMQRQPQLCGQRLRECLPPAEGATRDCDYGHPSIHPLGSKIGFR